MQNHYFDYNEKLFGCLIIDFNVNLFSKFKLLKASFTFAVIGENGVSNSGLATSDGKHLSEIINT